MDIPTEQENKPEGVIVLRRSLKATKSVTANKLKARNQARPDVYFVV